MITEIERPHPVRVGVDGFSAAGKSTLADELAAMVTGQGRPCLRADLDDFKRPRAERTAGPEGFYRGAFDLDAIRKFLLAPLGPGGDRQIRLRFFDQQHQTPFPAEVQSVTIDAVVIADGAQPSGSTTPRLIRAPTPMSSWTTATSPTRSSAKARAAPYAIGAQLTPSGWRAGNGCGRPGRRGRTGRDRTRPSS